MIYHGLQSRVYKMLQEIPWTRERRRKDEALIRLLTNNKQWDGEMAVFRLSELVEIAKDYDTANRYWRQILAENPSLQGRDYSTKKILEQRKEISLGYEVGYDHDRRMARMF